MEFPVLLLGTANPLDESSPRTKYLLAIKPGQRPKMCCFLNSLQADLGTHEVLFWSLLRFGEESVLGSPFRWYGIVRSVARQGKYRHNKAKKAPGSDHTLLCGYITGAQAILAGSAAKGKPEQSEPVG